MANESNGHDVEFLDAMRDLLGMDDDAVESLLEKLNADQLQDLTDAIAKRDRETAEAIIANANIDDTEVNALFRGENLDNGADGKKTRKRNEDGRMQFAIGDDVLVNVKDRDGKVHSVSATVAKPDGPEGTNTVVVKIKGKSTVVDKRNLDKLEENVLGMIGLPNLGRIQQLAGIQSQSMAQQPEGQVITDPEPIADPAPDDPLGQAMQAFDTLEAALPNIALANLKCVRERLTALQASLNENLAPLLLGRVRKL